MALHLNENIKLPDLEVYSSSVEIQPAQFWWDDHMWDYIGLQFHVYKIQWCFEEEKMFTFNSWNVEFLYALDYTHTFLSPRQVSDMLETKMPKTHDLDVIKKWAANQTEAVLMKCMH